MRWRLVLSCAVATLLTLGSVHGASDTMQGEYLAIYLKLNDSERLERGGDYRGALEGFEDCYNRLRKLQVRNPDWEHVLVTSRMEDCKAKIASLEPKVEEGGGVVSPINPGTAATPAGIEDAPLKMRLQEVENELAATKQQLADVTAKYKNSQLEVSTLRAQLDSVNQQLSALKSSQSVDQSMGQLMAQNKALTDRLAVAQSEIKALTGSPKSKAAKLLAQLKLVQQKLDETQTVNVSLTETTSTLQAQLNQAQNDLALANQKLAASGPGSPEYLTLKRENEVMRGILTREIQEQSRRDGAKRIAQEEFDRLKINSKVLQEQLDILASPMTPPGNDEERSLIASLKAGNEGVMAIGGGGNSFSATTNGAPVVSEGNVAVPPNPVPPATNAPAAVASDTNAAPATTNAAPAVATDTNAAPATNAPAVATETNAAPAPAATNTPSAVASDTNAAPATNPASTSTNAAPSVAATTNAAPAPETNAATATPPSSATPPANAGPPTNTAPAVATDTNAAPATNAPPVATETNAPSAPTSTNTAPAVATDTNAAPSTSTNAAPATNNVASADPGRFSNKPRLPDDMREVAQEATDLFKMQRYDEAAAKYQTIIDKYPESLYAWSNLGVVRVQEGKLEDARKALQRAVALSPNDAFSYRNLGIVYYQLNQNDAAIDALERSIALEPNNVYSHDYLGCACSQKGWQEVAEKEFRKAIEINEDFPDAHYNLAVIYAMQKPPALELARHHYKRAIELGLPKDPHLEKLLGIDSTVRTTR